MPSAIVLFKYKLYKWKKILQISSYKVRSDQAHGDFAPVFGLYEEDSGRNYTVLQNYMKLKWFSKRFLYLIFFIFDAKTWLFSSSRRRSTSTWWSNAEAILDQESATWTHGSTKWVILSSLYHGIICFYMQGPPNSYLHVFPLFAMFDDFKKMYCPNEQLTVQWTLSYECIWIQKLLILWLRFSVSNFEIYALQIKSQMAMT